MSQTGIFVQIHKEILEGSLQLPALPDVAIRIRTALRNPNIDLHGVGKIIQADPGLTAYLIQIANSPVYRGSRAVESLSVALSRLGLAATRNLAMTYALAALYNSDQQALKPMLKKVWQQGTRLASLSCVLARHCRGFDPDKAMLAGLIQDIGTLPLLQKAAKFPELIADTDLLEQLIHRYSANVGCTLLKHWGFEEDMIEVIRSREDWTRDKHTAPDYCDIVLIARFHTYVGTVLMKDIPKLTEMPAFHKLPLGEVNVQFSLKLLDEAKQQVSELQRSLGG